MNKKFRFIALMLAFAMIAMASLSGCSINGGEQSKSGDYVMDPILNPLGSETICKETVELEFMMGQLGTVTDYETNSFTRKVEEKGNIEIKFNLLPSADSTQKINLTLSSGSDLPDVVINTDVFDDTAVSTYGEAGTFVPLNMYYENSSEYLMPKIEQYEKDTGINLLEYITMSDGNIYTIPSYNESLQNEFPAVLWMYKPWLDKLGMEVPDTLDEFVECLKAFRDNDLNGNGLKDEIPAIDYARSITDNRFFNSLLQAFIKSSSNLTALKGDKVTMVYTTDEYKEFLKWANMLYSEGLIDKTTFSQDQATLKTLINGETTRVGTFCNTSLSIITAGNPKRENQEYVPVFLENGDEATIFYSKTMPINRMFITKDCEHPEVAFRVGDFMTNDEMTIWTRWGEKGVDWVEPAEGTAGMYDFMGYPALIQSITQWGTVQNSHWAQGSPSFRTKEVALGMVDSDSSQQSKANALKVLYDRYGEDMGINEKDRIYKLINTADELAEISTITTIVNSYVASSQYKFITGEMDVDKDWDAYIKELKASNVDRLVELYQVAYDRMK